MRSLRSFFMTGSSPILYSVFEGKQMSLSCAIDIQCLLKTCELFTFMYVVKIINIAG